jgi:hypothetical protein
MPISPVPPRGSSTRSLGVLVSSSRSYFSFAFFQYSETDFTGMNMFLGRH